LTTFDAPSAVNGTNGQAINPKRLILGFYNNVIGFDPTGSTDTEPIDINPAGAVTGSYLDASSVWHGFLRHPDGSIITVDIPGAGRGTFQGTIAIGINPAGVITGDYSDADGVTHGFVRAKDGTITTFDILGATGTEGVSLSPSGVITGNFSDATGVVHGFLRIP